MVFSIWSRFHEMEEVSGERHAEMLGANHITFAYHNDDEAILKAKQDTSFNSLPGSVDMRFDTMAGASALGCGEDPKPERLG